MSDAGPKDPGTWDTSVGLMLGIILLAIQFSLGFSSLSALLACLSALTAVFALFLLRAARGRQLPLVFLDLPVVVWSIFWVVASQEIGLLLLGVVVVGPTLAAWLIAKIDPRWCCRNEYMAYWKKGRPART